MSRTTGPYNVATTYARLKPDASAEAIPVSESFWQDLGAGKFGSFENEFLVTTQSFAQNWPVWEMHPKGEEIVILLSGDMDLILEKKNWQQNRAFATAGRLADGAQGAVAHSPGECAKYRHIHYRR